MGAKVLACSIFLTSALLVASVGGIIFWVFWFRGGYALQGNRAKEFNWHPTLMVSGFIGLAGLSLMFHRMTRCCNRICVKLLQTLLHLAVIAAVAAGFLAVHLAGPQAPSDAPDLHRIINDPKLLLSNIRIPKLYSLHSWLGVTTGVLFVLNFIFNFLSLIVQTCCGNACCQRFLEALGLINVVMAATTAFAGLTEKSVELQDRQSTEGIVINVIGITIAATCISLAFTVRVPGRSKRR